VAISINFKKKKKKIRRRRKKERRNEKKKKGPDYETIKGISLLFLLADGQKRIYINEPVKIERKCYFTTIDYSWEKR
jgi:hypothetical protein